jgi:hypothetical protein
MRAPKHFRLVITGNTTEVATRERMSAAIGYHLARLLTGEDTSDSALEGFGLRVEVEEDTDQGDD